MKSPLIFGPLLCLLCLIPATVYANVVLPSLMYQWPAMFFMFIPVLTIEFIVFVCCLPVAWGRALYAATACNVVSTIIGVPLASVSAAFVGQILYFIGKFLGIREVGEPWRSILRLIANTYLSSVRTTHWITPASMLLWLVPCFFITVFIERLVCSDILDTLDKTTVRKCVCRANLYSYTLLFSLCIFALLLAVFR